jgi:histidinol-phosphate aminotransferase
VKSALALARPELLDLPAAARAEPVGAAATAARLDANEVPWRPARDRGRPGLNRYPPVRAAELERRLAELYGVAEGSVVATRGSDEAIDLLVRAFCRPGRDAVVVLPPTFGMYALAARIQGARALEAPRRRSDGFAIDPGAVAARLDQGAKLVFVPDPDNPTGRAVAPAELDELARSTAGRALLVVDQAYAEFAAGGGEVLSRLAEWPHLVVLRTLSKAHALAGVRCGAAIARPEVIGLLARILPPYPLGRPTIAAALAQLEPGALALPPPRVAALVAERQRLARRLAPLGAVREVFPSAANFLLVAFGDRGRAERALARAGLVARGFDESAIADCLRVTVGRAAENRRLLRALETA